MTAAIDLGALSVKIATDERVTSVAAPSGGPRASVRAALAAVGQPGGRYCVAVPDAWLSGEVTGARRQEDVRHECEDLAGTAPVIWTGQLAAVAALAAGQHGDGRYLVCDLGGTGIRAGLLAVSDGTVEILATWAANGGGWLDFDAAVRAAAPAALSSQWAEQAAQQDDRARMVLADALGSPEEFADTRAYRIPGPGGDVDLTARLVVDGFAPAGQRLRDAVAAVAAAGPADGVVLTGGLAWVPLAAWELAAVTGATPLMVAPDAAARGALLFARALARLAPPDGCPAVSVPAHRIHDGLLEEVSVTLPWTAPFALPHGDELTIDRDELELSVDGQHRTARLPGLRPGLHRVGVRTAWPGPGVLVVRPAAGDGAHIVPLASLAAR